MHYDHLNDENANILPLDEHKLATLVKAKEARYALGGENIHGKQCSSVPSELKPEIQGTHVDCYKKFTLAISTARKRNVLQDITNQDHDSKRLRRTMEKSSQIFGPECMICKSDRPVKVNGKKQLPHVIKEESGIINSAVLRKDEQMLILMSGNNLVNRQFKVHRKCHTNYIRVQHKAQILSDNSTDSREGSFIKSNAVGEIERYVREEIIGNAKVVSLAYLTELCGKDKNDRQHRYRVKEKLIAKFPELIFFDGNGSDESQIVVAQTKSSTIDVRKIMNHYKDEAIRFAASNIRKDVLEFVDSASEIPWPPRSRDLCDESRRPPTSVLLFYKTLLQDNHHSIGENTERFVLSYSQDVVHSLSNGKFLTAKHTLLANAILTMTG